MGALHSCSNARQPKLSVSTTSSFDSISLTSRTLAMERDFKILNSTLMDEQIHQIHSELTAPGTLSCEFSQSDEQLFALDDIALNQF